MRVIAGEAKGRTLVAAKGGATRSATDRIRETLFAILEPRLEDAAVLDLFAGAGTLGIEALSRGAKHATFVERSPAALAALRRNLASTGFLDRAEVVTSEVGAFLGRASGPFDLVFVDPPFADVAGMEAALARVGALLAADGLVVARALRKGRPALPHDAGLAREREIGEETLMFLRYARA